MAVVRPRCDRLTEIEIDTDKNVDLDLADLALDDSIPGTRFPDREQLEKNDRPVSRALIDRDWVVSGEYATLHDLLLRYTTSYGHCQIVGTAEKSARIIETWIDEDASDGFIPRLTLPARASIDILYR
nr:hypothetical protein [Rhodococcus sp. (in: high G+C Gram-positive bacteria)]